MQNQKPNYMREPNKEAVCYNRKFGHEYIAGICIRCFGLQNGEPQKAVDNSMQSAMARFQRKKPNVKIHSAAHELADRITTEFGEKKLFGRYLGIINRVGTSAAEQLFSEIKQSQGVKNQGKLFFYKAGKLPKKSGEVTPKMV